MKPLPVFKDKSGCNYDERDACGFQVAHDIVHPDYFLMADEAGENLNQKGDGNIGGTRLTCQRVNAPKKVTSSTDKNFTALRFTSSNGDPAMSCVMIAVVVQSAQIETGIDVTKQIVGDVDDPKFFENNFGEGKSFPGGPIYTFRGKKVPFFVRWSEKGNIKSNMLTEILREMDARELFDRSNGK